MDDRGRNEDTDVYNICVHGTDIPGNTGADACTLLPVYDPTGSLLPAVAKVLLQLVRTCSTRRLLVKPHLDSFPNILQVGIPHRAILSFN